MNKLDLSYIVVFTYHAMTYITLLLQEDSCLINHYIVQSNFN